MHERALMDDLVRKVLAVAAAEDASSVSRIRVRLGGLSHFTPEHFVEHWIDASRGTLAEGAEVDAVMDKSLDGDAAQDGLVSPTYDEAKMSAYMKKQELEVSVDVGVGRGAATIWTCDLTKQYVAINGDYRS